MVLLLQAHFVKFLVSPSWHETAILPFNPLLFYFPSTHCSCFSPLWAWFTSDGGKYLKLKSLIFVMGFHRLLRASIGWFHRMALGLYCPYGWALNLVSWGSLTHLKLILDGYFKCVSCTCGLWACMARELIITGFRLIVWVSCTHRFKISFLFLFIFYFLFFFIF